MSRTSKSDARAKRDSQVPLSSFERFAVSLGLAINETATGRLIQNIYLRGVGFVWTRAALSRWMLADGLDTFRALAPERGVLLVCNHRSFFDLFAVSVAFFAAPTPWIRRIAFPVRSDFFYERPAGVLVNLLAGGGVMYPPIFRQKERGEMNRRAIGHLANVLRRPGWLVGYHPEGTRNKTGDAYVQLPMRPGAGELALRSGAIVVPVFINGLSNDLLGDIRRGFGPPEGREPCIAVFGEPVNLDGLHPDGGSEAHLAASERMGAAIRALAEREKRVRADHATGLVGDDDPRWIRNLPGSKLYAFRREAA